MRVRNFPVERFPPGPFNESIRLYIPAGSARNLDMDIWGSAGETCEKFVFGASPEPEFCVGFSCAC